MEKILAAVLEGPRTINIKEFPMPEIGPDDMLIKVEITGIDGTDVSSYKGELPKEFYSKQYPRIMGDEVVGYVEKIGEVAARRYKVKAGDRVIIEPKIGCNHCRFCEMGYFQFCKESRTYGIVSCTQPPYLWGGQAQYMYVTSGSRVHKIRENIPAKVAVLGGNVLSDGIRWVETGGVRIGDTVVILGPGPQGLASIVAAKAKGASLIIVSGIPSDKLRLEVARDLGADYVINVEKEDLKARVKEITDGEMADVVIECAGKEETVQAGIDILRPLGTCVLVGIPTQKSLKLSTITIPRDELTIKGVRAPLSWSTDSAIRLIESGRFPLEKIVSHSFPLAKAAKALQTAAYENPDVVDFVKVTIEPWS